ncbi:MAG: glycerol-3-phosphate dehydrogenase [Bacteroidetes bacterium]|nr:glycerol-3-phosphate dehydrogenase [Bacteroidota bacterium]
MNFSSKNRTTIINSLNELSFDLLVIGGGITGAGIALDASARGLKVVLIEMQDFASGTSGRSTKLIHGGLRYLKQGEFKLVAEVGRERKIIYKNSPHLTSPEPMLLPLVKGGSLGKFSARLGMYLYEWLAGVEKEERHRVLNKVDTSTSEPMLVKNTLLGGILFYEYRTDDARLTIEVLKEAVSRGTCAVNYMKVTDFIYNEGMIKGVEALDMLDGKKYSLKAQNVVNAAGPWVQELDKLDKQLKQIKLQITKGVHLVVDNKKLPVKHAMYFDTFDKRMLFVIPREGKTYIGTTDTFYSGNLNQPLITKEDRDYILKCVNDYFPENMLSAKDIESGWAGLRPLINKHGKKASEISRKDEMFVSSSGLLTIAGGKLTGYRKMAQRVVDALARKIKVEKKILINPCSTDTISLSGGKLYPYNSFVELKNEKVKEGIKLGLSFKEAEMLIARYGSNVNSVFGFVELLKEESHILPLLLRAELHYAITHEMCMSPADFFIRRTGMLYFDIATVKKWQEILVQYMQPLLMWDENLTNKFQSELKLEIVNLERLNMV